jgi:hypothetical protein
MFLSGEVFFSSLIVPLASLLEIAGTAGLSTFPTGFCASLKLPHEAVNCYYSSLPQSLSSENAILALILLTPSLFPKVVVMMVPAFSKFDALELH